MSKQKKSLQKMKRQITKNTFAILVQYKIWYRTKIIFDLHIELFVPEVILIMRKNHLKKKIMRKKEKKKGKTCGKMRSGGDIIKFKPKMGTISEIWQRWSEIYFSSCLCKRRKLRLRLPPSLPAFLLLGTRDSASHF